MSGKKDEIDVTPTKRFFVDMFTRDIPLEQAILDLIDNSIDAAERTSKDNDLSKCSVEIKFGKDEFRITDNCGGFDKETAREYAFRFGRPEKHKPGPHSIGQFGVGMKRALFKFGSHFLVRSATSKDEWGIDIKVADWVKTEDWHFPWAQFRSDRISKKKPGTEIIVTDLRLEVAEKFATSNFNNSIVKLIKSKHRQFISQGLSIKVNGHHIATTQLTLLVKDRVLRPGVENAVFKNKGKKEVRVRITVGVSDSLPREAGWYVIGNGRIILEADRRPETGWGALEDGTGKLSVPVYHNQFARFRGIVSFDSDDSSQIPWNTMKNDVDKDNPVWRISLQTMTEMMRPVIDFLNELDADIDEHTRQHSPMLNIIKKARSEPLETFTKNTQFSAPDKASSGAIPKMVTIKYSKPSKDVEFLKDALNVSSAPAVGEKTFDLALTRQKR